MKRILWALVFFLCVMLPSDIRFDGCSGYCGAMPKALQIPSLTLNGGLPKWQACRAKVKDGTGSCTILIIGESTSAGNGCAYRSPNSRYSRACSWPSQLAAIFQQLYDLPASTHSIMGNAGATGGTSAASYQAYDPRAMLHGWAINTGQPLVGQGTFQSRDASVFQFNPTNSLGFPSNAPVQTDTLDVYTIAYGRESRDTLSINVNGGESLGTIVNDGMGSVERHTFSTTLGNNIWGLTNTVRGLDGSYVQGIVAYDSTAPQIKIINGSWGGAMIANWTTVTNGMDPQQMVKLIAPDLCIGQIAGNDAGAGTSIPTYVAAYESVITSCQASGDFLLVNSQPANPALVSYATSQSYAAAGQTIAATKNAPILDVFQLLCGWNGSTCTKGGWTAGMGAGWNGNCCALAADPAHNGGVFYGIEAHLIAEILML